MPAVAFLEGLDLGAGLRAGLIIAIGCVMWAIAARLVWVRL